MAGFQIVIKLVFRSRQSWCLNLSTAGDRTGDLWWEGIDLTNCTNHTHLGKFYKIIKEFYSS